MPNMHPTIGLTSMMFGKLRPRRIIFWLLLGLALDPSVSLAQGSTSKVEPQSIDKVLDQLKTQKNRRIPFQEFRMIPALKAPIQSKGVLAFYPPDTLIKSVEIPVPSTYVLSSTEIKVTDGATGESRSLNPETIPELDYIGSSLRSLLNGDKAALLSRWHISLGGSNREWKLNLVPIDPAVSGLRRVEFQGQESDLKKIHIEALDGSSSQFILGNP